MNMVLAKNSAMRLLYRFTVPSSWRPSVHTGSPYRAGPRFPGWTRDLANRYDVAFSPNGQCFRMNIPPRGANAFYATNTHVTRISPVGLPLTSQLGFTGTITVHGAGLQHPNLPDAVCRFTRLNAAGEVRFGASVTGPHDGDGAFSDEVVLTPFTTGRNTYGTCEAPTDEGFWMLLGIGGLAGALHVRAI